MRLFLKLAWRNIFRNKRRTFIAGTAIGIGLASLIYTDALIVGMEQNMIHSATASFMGEGQIHRKGFRQTFELESTINDPSEVMAGLKKEKVVAHFTPRVISYGMISSPANVSSVSMVGIDPATEKYVSQIDDALVQGVYFEGNNKHDVVIGNELADLMEVGLGDRIVLTVAQAYTGDLSEEMFRVSGIYHINIQTLDKGMAFVRLAEAQAMLNLPGQIHEIAIDFKDSHLGRDEQAPFWRRYSQNGNEAVGWTVLLPQMKAAFDLNEFSLVIVGIVLFAVVSLGIVNTLFMSLYERMFEFGVMRAVGTRPLAMGRLIVFEAGALAVVSSLFGMLLGLVVSYASKHFGFDFAGVEYAGVTFREILYPVIELKQYVVYPVAVILFTVLIGLYPASYAARMNAAQAMRRSF